MSTTLSLFDDSTPPPGPPGPTVRVRLVVAYNGTAFHGFAPNPGVATVGGRLIEALEKILRHPVDLTVAGRTDKGVHAHGQVVDFLTTAGADLTSLTRAVNSLVGPAIAVRGAELADESFSSRFDATYRRYRYTVYNSEVPDPFSTDTAWQIKEPLDLARLRLGCDPLLGTHDFASFCRRATGNDGEVKSTVRDVYEARWERVDATTLYFWVQASSFCHQMVRSLVGTLVDVGRGKVTPGEIRGIIAAQDRSAARPVAPPHGLSLWEVGYTDPFSRG